MIGIRIINTEVNNSKVEVISKDYGVVQVETNPTKDQTEQFVDLLRPQIQKQTYKENKGKNANEMFHYGLMWARTNRLAKPVKINAFDKGVYYAYHELDQNQNKLPNLSVLQPIINEIQNSLGLDMSDYDSVIGNIYLDDQYIYPHKDTTESVSARNYPVIVYTLGNDAGLGIVDNNEGKMTFANQYDKQWLPVQEKLKGYTNELKTKNGSIYTFGLDGNGRFELTHSTPMNNKKMKDFPPITLPNGKVVTKYTITLTFRRAKDLDETTPITPKKLQNISNQSIDNNIEEKTDKKSGDIILNTGQKEALNKFTKFLDKGKNKFFLLKGRAGTGKTTIAGTMMQVANKKGFKIFATAISDAATTNLSVLSKNTPGSNIEIYNFAAMYGLVPQYDDDGTMTGFDFPSENSQVESAPKITNSDKTILIFDESSMVSLDTLDKIKKLTPDITILYMGDNAQIMPIGDTKISTVFGLEDQHELTEVMRQKENSPILDIASNIAQEIDVYDNTGELKLSPILDKIYTDFNKSKNSGTIVTDSGEEFINEAVSDFKKYGNKQTLVITGNNNNVASLNKKIREKVISSQEQFTPGERLMTYTKYSKYMGKNVPKLEIFNSSVINILSVTPSNVEGVPTNNLSVEYVDQQGKTRQTYMNVIHKNNVEDIKQFYDNKKKLNAEYKRTKDRSILDRLNAYSQTVLVDYAYAMTAHKAQGQTVRNTYVVPVYRGFSEIESRRMFYTSITRPTDKLVIFDQKANESNITNKFSNKTETKLDITSEELGLNTNLSQKDAKCPQ
jgi:alkylated DNA repair dioxygenase AlkB